MRDAVGRGDHYRITPTARVVAYFRSFSDIPYASETSTALGGEEAARQMVHSDLALVTGFAAPFLEARYKCFNRFTATHRNVLELAVGTSVERGLSISDNHDKIYIGTDLPEMIEELRAFFTEVNHKERTNHYLQAANVLSYEELKAAANPLGGRGDVLIINEGLWGYLTTEEQAVFAANIRRLLEQYGGKWVTPDIRDLESKEQFISSLPPEMRLAMEGLSQATGSLTGRDLGVNFFANKQQVISFLEKFGFEVDHYPMVDDLGCLTSIASLWGERESRLYEPALKQHLVWVMSLRK